MKTVLFALALCAGLEAQTPPIAVYLDNSGGQQPVSQLQGFPANYGFPDTPVGSSSVIGARVVNTSGSSLVISSIGFVSGSQQNNNFTSDLGFSLSLAPGQTQFFHIYYVPFATGATTATAQMGVTGNMLVSFSTLQGNGTAPQIALSCNNPSVQRCDGNILQPNEFTAINFGPVSRTSSSTATFTLFNGGANSIVPSQLVVLQTATNNPSTAFQLGTLPATIGAGSSGTFTVTFAPGSTATQQVSLLIGSNRFILQGVGTASVIGDISSLTITYTDSTGVNLTAQAASPINFGTTVSGSGVTSTLLFTVLNPATTIGAVSVPSISVSGAGFAISGANPAPVSIQPGASATFRVVFSGSTTGNYSGTLSIGSRSFSMVAQSITSSQPTPSLTIDQQPLMSQQQAHVTVQLASAASTGEIGTLTMKFTPSVTNITDDPAVEFVATSSRQLQVTVANA
ncbi:MAG TPA: choice-of-anchor D domain-containing protein, partial [Bryobacteraceae bacterium]|nr:choice-of-anchor D domain-containing protein [Bryobacteraceae bacterium]